MLRWAKRSLHVPVGRWVIVEHRRGKLLPRERVRMQGCRGSFERRRGAGGGRVELFERALGTAHSGSFQRTTLTFMYRGALPKVGSRLPGPAKLYSLVFLFRTLPRVHRHGILLLGILTNGQHTYAGIYIGIVSTRGWYTIVRYFRHWFQYAA